MVVEEERGGRRRKKKKRRRGWCWSWRRRRRKGIWKEEGEGKGGVGLYTVRCPEFAVYIAYCILQIYKNILAKREYLRKGYAYLRIFTILNFELQPF